VGSKVRGQTQGPFMVMVQLSDRNMEE
jgi:hypothetical protein